MEQKTGKKIRAMFFDLDGTLLSFNTHRIPASAKRALARAREAGVLLFLATGRHPLSFGKGGWLEELGFSGYVAMNGQLCCLGEELIFSNPIDRGDIRELLRRLEKNPMPCVLMERSRAYINYIDPVVESEQAFIGEPLPEIGDISGAGERDIYQACLYSKDKGAIERLTDLPHSRCTWWHDFGVDLISDSCNKWRGIEEIIRHCGISPSETAAFGDGENDIEMLTHAGVSVAMGNAGDAVKAAADIVTADIDSDGLAKAIEMIL